MSKRGTFQSHDTPCPIHRLGFAIGTGLFVGSSKFLVMGQPAFFVGGYIFMLALIYLVPVPVTGICAYLSLPRGKWTTTAVDTSLEVGVL